MPQLNRSLSTHSTNKEHTYKKGYEHTYSALCDVNMIGKLTNGTNTFSEMFNTSAQCDDMFQVDRFT